MEFEKLCEIIADEMNVDISELNRDTDLVYDLGADSLDIFRIAMGMEEVFDMEFSIPKLNEARTIADIMDMVSI